MASELTEWRPFSDFAELRHRLDQAFRDLSEGAQRGGWSPSVDLVKKDDQMVLPRGVQADDIEAKCENGVLEVTIPAPRGEEKQKVEIKPKVG